MFMLVYLFWIFPEKNREAWIYSISYLYPKVQPEGAHRHINHVSYVLLFHAAQVDSSWMGEATKVQDKLAWKAHASVYNVSQN